MNVSYVHGDMVKAIDEFQSPEKLHVAHGCNCFHTMGAGVAKALVNRFGIHLVMTDQTTPYGDINKLGTYSRFLTPEGICVYNCYTQHGMKKGKGRSKGVYVHWPALGNALMDVVFDEMKEGDTLFIPKIGTGMAGGTDKDFKLILDDLCYVAKMHKKVHYNLVIFSL